jgi:hypothetical protein
MKVVVGDSPRFPTHTGVEYHSGTFYFLGLDLQTLYPMDAPFNYAALVITRINSIIDEKTFCCDLGHKAIAAENPLAKGTFFKCSKKLFQKRKVKNI